MLRLCCGFHMQESVSVVVIFKIEVARDFYVTKQRISTSWGCLSTSRLLEESSLRRVTVADGCLHRRAESNFRFVPVAQTQCPSTSRKPSLKKSLSSPILPCARALLIVHEHSLPDVRLTTKGQLPHDESCRSLRMQFSFDSQMQSQAAGETHVALFRPSWKRKPFLILFSESGREECSSGRNDAPSLRVLGAKLRLHQVFWSQNLAFQSQNATMRPDFSSPASSLPRNWRFTFPFCSCNQERHSFCATWKCQTRARLEKRKPTSHP